MSDEHESPVGKPPSEVEPNYPELRFHKLAFDLLGIDHLPSPLLMGGAEGDPFLTKADYERLALIVADRLKVSPDYFWQADEDRRMVLLSQCIGTDRKRSTPRRKRRSTGKPADNNMDESVKAALRLYHQYDNGSILRHDPASLADLATLAGCSNSTVSRHLPKCFDGHKGYVRDCMHRRILQKLTELSDDKFEHQELRDDD